MKRRLINFVAIICLLFCYQAPILAANTTINVSVCRGAPSINIASPGDGAVTTDASVDVSGNGTAGASLSISRNSVTVASLTIGGSGAFSVSVPLNTGSNSITGYIQNSCGSQASNTVKVTRQSSSSSGSGSSGSGSSSDTGGNSSGSTGSSSIAGKPPATFTSLKITFPPDNYSTSGSTIIIRGQGPSGRTVTFYLNGQEQSWVDIGDDSSFIMSMGLVVGKNEIMAKINDSSEQYSVTVYRSSLPAAATAKKTGSSLGRLIAIGGGMIILASVALWAALRRRSRSAPLPPTPPVAPTIPPTAN